MSLRHREKLQPKGGAMSAVLHASSLARRLVESEARQAGTSLVDAIPAVARRLRASHNAVYALLFRLPKKVDADLCYSLEGAVADALQREIRTLENEMAAIISGARRLDASALAEVEADIARLKSRLRGGPEQ
jgi:hypothetical protein